MTDLCKIHCENSDILDLCPVYDLYSPASGKPIEPKFAMLWRFAPMADPTVAEWHSRDLDSRVSPREWAAVSEWKESNTSFHIMRDHTHHYYVILGGMFGSKVSASTHRIPVVCMSSLFWLPGMILKNNNRSPLARIFDSMLRGSGTPNPILH